MNILSIIGSARALKRAFECRLQAALQLTRRPVMINFAVTSRCNLLCTTCNVGRNYFSNPSIAEDDLKVDEIDALFSKNCALLKDVRTIQITGGEPFMRDDLVKIIEVIHHYLPKCAIWIATNGTMPKVIKSEVAKIAKIHRYISIGVSLDGSEVIHDQMRGVKETFFRAIQTLGGLVELRKQMPWINVALSFTITPFNCNEIQFVYELSKKYDVWFTFRPTHISSIYYRNVGLRLIRGDKNGIEQVKTTLSEIGKDLVKNLGFFGALPHLYFMSGTIRFLVKGHPPKRNYRCYAGSSSFFLDGHGNVFPCITVNKRMGNIRERSFENIWKSQRAAKIRREIQKYKCPNCWVECETYANMYEDFVHLAVFLLAFQLRADLTYSWG